MAKAPARCYRMMSSWFEKIPLSWWTSVLSVCSSSALSCVSETQTTMTRWVWLCSGGSLPSVDNWLMCKGSVDVIVHRMVWEPEEMYSHSHKHTLAGDASDSERQQHYYVTYLYLKWWCVTSVNVHVKLADTHYRRKC